MAGKIQQQTAMQKTNDSKSLTALMNDYLDGEKLRKRFDELLGKRAPQFISSLITMIGADENLLQAFRDNPNSVIKSGLKSATYDLPIDPALGYAYIVPFWNNGKREATFVPGWKGYHQLALRTAMYSAINVVDIREGELVSYDRLTERIKVNFYDDDEEREQHDVIGYVGYYRLINGFEKTIYRTIKQIYQHEKQHRKGENMGYGWKKWPRAMERKTVYRELIGTWGIMSIDYKTEAYADLTQLTADDRYADTLDHIDVPETSVIVTNEDGEVIFGDPTIKEGSDQNSSPD